MTPRVIGLLSLLAFPLAAQTDPVSVSSPDGRIQFHMAIILPHEPYAFLRNGYEISFRGKPVIETSYLGLRIYDQEPLLGENIGMIDHKSGSEKNFNFVIAEYMQNGSLGRRLTLEVRAFNQGVAFRYIIPKSTPLEDLFISDEATQFHFPSGTKLGAPSEGAIKLPFTTEIPGSAWIEITETHVPKYPPMTLDRQSPSILAASLPENGTDPDTAVATRTPFTCPWRVILIASDRAGLKSSEVLPSLD